MRQRYLRYVLLMIRFLVLDLDGPILEGKFRHYACYSRILETYGYKPLSLVKYWQMKRNRMSTQQLLEATDAEDLLDKFLQMWLETIEQPDMLALDRLQIGVPEKLQQWREQELILILATLRRFSDHLHAQLAYFGLDALLDYIVVCEHQLGGIGKAERVKAIVPQISPEHSLWIGDTEIDVGAARAFGCPIWAVSCGIRTESYLVSQFPDFLSTDLKGINLRG
jgi:phosphoglycolate phosphatase